MEGGVYQKLTSVRPIGVMKMMISNVVSTLFTFKIRYQM